MVKCFDAYPNFKLMGRKTERGALQNTRKLNQSMHKNSEKWSDNVQYLVFLGSIAHSMYKLLPNLGPTHMPKSDISRRPERGSSNLSKTFDYSFWEIDNGAFLHVWRGISVLNNDGAFLMIICSCSRMVAEIKCTPPTFPSLPWNFIGELPTLPRIKYFMWLFASLTFFAERLCSFQQQIIRFTPW